MIGYISAFWTLCSEQNVCSLTIGRQGCDKSQATSCKVNRFAGVGIRLQMSYKKLDSLNTSTGSLRLNWALVASLFEGFTSEAPQPI